jgi:hypothetical protein
MVERIASRVCKKTTNSFELVVARVPAKSPVEKPRYGWGSMSWALRNSAESLQQAFFRKLSNAVRLSPTFTLTLDATRNPTL